MSKWTRERPTTEGWFWYKEWPGSEPRPMKISGKDEYAWAFLMDCPAHPLGEYTHGFWAAIDGPPEFVCP